MTGLLGELRSQGSEALIYMTKSILSAIYVYQVVLVSSEIFTVNEVFIVNEVSIVNEVNVNNKYS